LNRQHNITTIEKENMTTKRTIHVFAAAFFLMLGTVIATAHNGIEHVMGTVSAKTDTSVTVMTVKHTSVTVLLDHSTTFSYNDTKASLADIKTGERVVVNAKDNAEDKLVAVSVRWGAKSTATADHDDHKK
jgi:Cu/Ag efflux protein CusF